VLKIPYDKAELRELLDRALSTGADFAEFFFENTVSDTLEMTGKDLTTSVRSNIHGVAVRILKGDECVNGYTNSLSALEALTDRLTSSFEGERVKNAAPLTEVVKDRNIEFEKNPVDIHAADKVRLLAEAYEGAKAYSEEITQVLSRALDKCQEILVVNSEGVYATDTRTNLRFMVQCVASDGKDMMSGMRDAGGNTGFELLEGVNFAELGRSAAETAVTMLHADYIPGGKMTVVINNGFGGVILHEACVHSLEATSVAKNASVFCGKLGQKIASDVITAVDDGTLHNYWGSLNVDDEGHRTQRNVLIENGILKSYLVDYRNQKIMDHPATGSGRRQSYKYLPTSRMTNTFIENGTSTFEEIIAATEYGLFAKSMGGGSVQPATGEFNFAVNEGYLIENGKITRPVRGATLIGSGAEVLMNIDMVADNLATAHGMCGSLSGSIPTDVGEPTIRVQNMTVGGRKA